MERQTGQMKLYTRIIGMPATVFRKTWRIARRDRLFTATVCLVILLVCLASFCYVVIPDHTEFAGRKCIPICNQRPGFEVTMLRMVDNKPSVHQTFFSKIFFGMKSRETFIPIRSSRYEGTDILVRDFSASGDSSFESRYNI